MSLEGLAIAQEKGHTFVAAVTTFGLGWAAVDTSNAPVGYARMRGSIDALRSAGALIAQTMFLSLLADVAWRHGRTDLSETSLAEAEAVLAKGERHFEPEICRLRGQMTGDANLFRRAIDVSVSQGNRSFGLRAAVGLAGLLVSRGSQAEARAVLAPACSAFPEGHDTADLIAAASLLKQLA
ncbi:MAG: hypothetical protein EXS32_05740 [Opitutus sp.]|nr:hypothetical protein [Opitutus sp.]